MKQKPAGRSSSLEHTLNDIKRKTRKQYSAEEKIRIVLDGLRGTSTWRSCPSNKPLETEPFQQ